MARRTATLLISLVALLPALPGSASQKLLVPCLDKPATMVGTSGNDRLVGTDLPDVIAGLGGDDVIIGNDGDDRLCGGGGRDTLSGRYGNDLIDGDGAGDTARGGPGDDLLHGGEGRDRLLGGDGSDSDTLVGGAKGDSLSGGDGGGDEDYLFGSGGDDHLIGGLGGQDVLFGGPGDDYLGGSGRDTASFEFADGPMTIDLTDTFERRVTGEGSDIVDDFRVVVGSGFDDSITSDDTNHVLRGGAGDDSISGGAGDDRIDGGEGNDSLEGGAGTDTIDFTDSAAGVTADLTTGAALGAGTDSFTSFEDLIGSFFDDELTGTDGHDRIEGSYGTNNVFALGGNDYIEFADGGSAGPGEDECIWASIDSCEINGHFDPPALPYISQPKQMEERTRLGVVRGATAGGIAGPRNHTVLVSVRRMTPNGCSWWRGGNFQTGGCGTALSNVVTPNNVGEWELRVAEDLPPGSYQVSVTWRAKQWRSWSCVGAFEPMCIEFLVGP